MHYAEQQTISNYVVSKDEGRTMEKYITNYMLW